MPNPSRTNTLALVRATSVHPTVLHIDRGIAMPMNYNAGVALGRRQPMGEIYKPGIRVRPGCIQIFESLGWTLDLIVPNT